MLRTFIDTTSGGRRLARKSSSHIHRSVEGAVEKNKEVNVRSQGESSEVNRLLGK